MTSTITIMTSRSIISTKRASRDLREEGGAAREVRRNHLHATLNVGEILRRLLFAAARAGRDSLRWHVRGGRAAGEDSVEDLEQQDLSEFSASTGPQAHGEVAVHLGAARTICQWRRARFNCATMSGVSGGRALYAAKVDLQLLQSFNCACGAVQRPAQRASLQTLRSAVSAAFPPAAPSRGLSSSSIVWITSSGARLPSATKATFQGPPMGLKT
eukprot:27550-Rhodomonas_salina.3